MNYIFLQITKHAEKEYSHTINNLKPKNTCCKLYYVSIPHTIFTTFLYNKDFINKSFVKYSDNKTKYKLINHYKYHLPFTFIINQLEMDYIECNNPLCCNQDIIREPIKFISGNIPSTFF